MRLLSICANIITFALYTLYYGVTFTMNETGFNLYTTAIIIALCETAGYCVPGNINLIIISKFIIINCLIINIYYY